MGGSLVARIIGTGSYLPKRIMTNKEMEAYVDTTDEWIVTGLESGRGIYPMKRRIPAIWDMRLQSPLLRMQESAQKK